MRRELRNTAGTFQKACCTLEQSRAPRQRKTQGQGWAGVSQDPEVATTAALPTSHAWNRTAGVPSPSRICCLKPVTHTCHQGPRPRPRRLAPVPLHRVAPPRPAAPCFSLFPWRHDAPEVILGPSVSSFTITP